MVSLAGTLIPGLNSSKAGFLRESTIVFFARLFYYASRDALYGLRFSLPRYRCVKVINYVKSCYKITKNFTKI